MAYVKIRANVSKTVTKRAKGSGKIGKHTNWFKLVKQSFSNSNRIRTRSVTKNIDISQANDKSDAETNRKPSSQTKDKSDSQKKYKSGFRIKDNNFGFRIKDKSDSQTNDKSCSRVKDKSNSQINDTLNKVKASSNKLAKDSVKDIVHITGSIPKKKIHIERNRSLNENKHIKRSKENLKICNDILINELMICDNKEISTSTSQKIGLNGDNIKNSVNKNTVQTSPKDKKHKNRQEVYQQPWQKWPLPEKTPFECDYCLQQFHTKSNLKKHINLHLEQFQCDYCRKHFDTKSNLRRHIYLHLHPKTYSCRQCKRVFRTLLYLTAHIIKQHPDSDQHHKLCSRLKSDSKTYKTLDKVKASDNKLAKVKVKDTVLVTDSILKRKIHIERNRFLNENGHVIRKTKDNLKICNDILLNELMIHDNKEISTSLSQEIHLKGENIINSEEKSVSKNTVQASSKDKKHIKREHKYPKRKWPPPKKELFQCDYCLKQFETKSNFRRHMYLHLDPKTFECYQCKKVFANQFYLTNHVVKQHPNWDQHYMCNLCEKAFLSRNKLLIHMATHSDTEKMFKCIYCNEKYSEQLDLIEHEKKHLVRGLYDCIICEQSFECRNKLAFHFKSHQRVKDFICQYCGKEFVSNHSMNSHVQTIHTGITVQCVICKKFLKGHMAEHMRTHEKRRPHKCLECGQCFTQSTQLTVHKRIHTGVRPYHCRICSKAFSHSNALMMHIRRHTGEKPYECTKCPQSFSQTPHMKAHMKKIHGIEKPYKCKNCNKRFKRKTDLKSHANGCKVQERELSFEEKIEASVKVEEVKAVESVLSLTRMRFLLALLLTMVADESRLKFLGFNKRLIDDLLEESLVGMGHEPCRDKSLTPIKRLKTNIEILLKGTVTEEQMEKFKKENKCTEDILELLTSEKK